MNVVTLRIRSKRVFKPRIWLGMAIMRLALWIMGSEAEAARWMPRPKLPEEI